MNFEIDPAALCSVSIVKEWSIYDKIPREELTHKMLIDILTGADKCSSRSSSDHADFTKLRNQLEALGYIKCAHNYWNGDRVLKPFTLNNLKFYKDEKFPCGAAMKYVVESKTKNKNFRS